jgi:SAM-dependent methyltransferase
MVARARMLNPAVEFRQGDAEALAFPDASFDAVAMNFGMLHLARPELAMAEAARVLRPGGRYAFTVWAAPPETAGCALILNAIRAHGNPEVGLPEGPPFFRFSDPAECDRTLRAAGLQEVEVARVPQVWRFDRPDDVFDAFFGGGVRIKAVLRAQSGAALDAIRAATKAAAGRFARDSGIELPMPSVLASAVKPA